jgi:uncharacterized delta-60 repeat protein
MFFQGDGVKHYQSQTGAIEALEMRRLLSGNDSDPSFGKLGFEIIDIAGGDDHALAVAVQKDGKIVVAGQAYFSGNPAAAIAPGDYAVVARFNVDGSLDDGGPLDSTPGDKFGANGKIFIFHHASNQIGSAFKSVVIQSDGKIVLGGYTEENHPFSNPTDVTQWFVTRLLSNGTSDSGFGTSGSAVFLDNAAPSYETSIESMALQGDGKIVLGGIAGSSAVVARLTTSGGLDSTFSSDGLIPENVGFDAHVAIDNLGNIVSATGSNQHILLFRYTANGTLDRSFDADGKVDLSRGPDDAPLSMSIESLAIKHSGEILVGGFEYSIGGDYAYSASVSPDGKLIHEDLPDHISDWASLVVSLNDNVMKLGTTVNRESLNPGGIWADDGFTGHLLNFRPAYLQYTNAAALAPDGKIVVVGETNEGGSGFNFVIARVLGYPTSSFGSVSGTVFIDKDGDGVKDANETGEGNVRVYVDADKNGGFAASERSVLTDGSGNYTLTGLTPGTYTIREVVPLTFTQTLPTGGAAYTVTVAAKGNTSGKNFGNKPFSIQSLATSISGSVFNDLNGNGIRDVANPTEPDLVGWTVYLDKNKNGKLDSGETNVKTDGGGNYVFDKLAVGSYRVRVVMQAGYRQTGPGGGFYDVTVKNLQHIVNEKFGVTKNILISGNVFSDANGNKMRDTVKGVAEAGLSGWKVYIDGDKNGKFTDGETFVLSDGSGNWSFTGLAARSSAYIVRAVPMSKWGLTTPAGGSISVTLSARGSSKTGLLFGGKKIA